VTTPGSTLAAMREKVARTCDYCGKPFQALKTARYCCHSCRTMAYRKRNRGAKPPRP
jgi:hypothetical protein